MDTDKKTLKKRSALGKGLGALLTDSSGPSQDEGVAQRATDGPGMIAEIPTSAVEVNPFQPRLDFDEEALRELAESIRIQGIIQPITVRKLNADTYQLISGERRLQASRLIGLEQIPAYVRTANDQQMLEMALIENIQRENLNPIEIALSYQRLITECELLQEELGDRVGKKRSTVTNYLRLLKLPPEIQAALRDSQLSMGHARALINIDKVDSQLALFARIIKENLSVRKVEEMVRDLLLGSSQKQAAAKPAADPEKAYELKRLQDKLSSHFGTQVKVQADATDKGEIKIPFHSVAELNRILDLLNP
jgi:ParB family chromosome partitioning protein